ncbi:hypothetical protein Cgig2_018308 [Carnegiea gigantea]|uniref:Uncharacterized protein n=1 Tax=Carnegiea gigantea TaxID=171969 RepID=A0A9Q1KZB9_9CARY|nr:hypothetical protein Cgig2_018308 [Carnegiea gigantea]
MTISRLTTESGETAKSFASSDYHSTEHDRRAVGYDSSWLDQLLGYIDLLNSGRVPFGLGDRTNHHKWSLTPLKSAVVQKDRSVLLLIRVVMLRQLSTRELKLAGTHPCTGQHKLLLPWELWFFQLNLKYANSLLWDDNTMSQGLEFSSVRVGYKIFSILLRISRKPLENRELQMKVGHERILNISAHFYGYMDAYVSHLMLAIWYVFGRA